MLPIRYAGRVGMAFSVSVVLVACSGGDIPSSASNPSEKMHTDYLNAVNAVRAQSRSCGDTYFPAAPKLRWNAKLADAAQEHSQDMAQHDFMDHEGSDGSTPADRIVKRGYPYRSFGENVAEGQSDTEEAIQAWIKSPPHCKNLMSPKFEEMGMAVGENNANKYWTLDMGRE